MKGKIVDELLGSDIGQVPITVVASADPRRPDVPSLEETNPMGYKLSLRVAREIVGISAPSKAVLRAICDYVDERSEGNVCFPKIEDLMRDTMLSKSTVLRSIEDLQDRLMLFKVENFKGRRNGYRVALPKVSERHYSPEDDEGLQGVRETPLRCQSETIQGVTVTPPIELVNKPAKNKLSLGRTKPLKPVKEKFVPPTLEEVRECMKSRHFNHPHQEAEKFIAFYEEQDWCRRSGKVMVKLKDWRRAVIQWEKPWLVSTTSKANEVKSSQAVDPDDWENQYRSR